MPSGDGGTDTPAASTPTIRSIELVNFMCHSHFEIEFTKMITCITGRNGSGKSAVMIALGIVFGQRAAALDRGSSFKSLIKTGCNQAIIKICISNTLGLCPERYGSRITVEKRLRGTGSRSVIYDPQGVPCAASAAEISSIIDAYGLRFENPLNFLTQEQSKRFLGASRPEQLYDLYYKGSEFKIITDELGESLSRLSEMRERLAETINACDSTSLDLSAAESKLVFLETDHAAVLRSLEAESVAASLGKHISDLSEIDMLLSKMEEDAKNAESAAAFTVGDFASRSTLEIEGSISALKLKLRGLQNDRNEFVREASEREEALKALRSAENPSEALKSAEDALAKARERFSFLESAGVAVEEAVEEENRRNTEKKSRRFALEKQIEYLQRNSTDAATAAAASQHSAVADAVRGLRFRDDVLGPLSSYVTLRDQRWFRVASTVLRKSLDSYLVFCAEDRATLRGVFKTQNVNFPISLFSSKQTAHSLQKPRARLSEDGGLYPVLLDVLELRNPLFLNQLTTFHNAEQIVLVENREEAYKIVRSDIKNVDCAYTMTGDRIKLANGSLSDFRPRDDGRFWFEDKTSRVEALRRRLLGIAEDADASAAQAEHSKALHGARDALEAAARERSEAAARAAVLAGSEDDAATCERRLRALQRSASLLEGKIGNAEAELKVLADAKEAVEAENAAGQAAHLEAKREARRRAAEAELQIALCESKRDELIRRKRVVRDAVDRTVSELLELQPPGSGDDRCFCGVSLPGSVVPQLENPRDPCVVSAEKRAVKEHLRTASEMQSPEDIREEIAVLRGEKAVHERIRNKFESLISQTIEACERRITKRDEIKDKKSAEAAELFAHFMGRGGYDGELVFDHLQRRIDLRVAVHGGEHAGSKATLSGGERSYAGVCLLLALWRSFRCPVKVLDEFDVFMDDLNRRAAVRALFDFFRENAMQVILITPLSTDGLVEDDCEIRVLAKAE